MVERAVKLAVEAYLKTLRDNGVPVRMGIIFGSQANGTAHEWSDIDLLVISPRFDNMCDRQDINLLWRIAAQTDGRIEPILCGEKQWLEDDSSAIIEVARREGEIVSM